MNLRCAFMINVLTTSASQFSVLFSLLKVHQLQIKWHQPENRKSLLRSESNRQTWTKGVDWVNESSINATFMVEKVTIRKYSFSIS